jgi:hypothetical protein
MSSSAKITSCLSRDRVTQIFVNYSEFKPLSDTPWYRIHRRVDQYLFTKTGTKNTAKSRLPGDTPVSRLKNLLKNITTLCKDTGDSRTPWDTVHWGAVFKIIKAYHNLSMNRVVFINDLLYMFKKLYNLRYSNRLLIVKYTRVLLTNINNSTNIK